MEWLSASEESGILHRQRYNIAGRVGETGRMGEMKRILIGGEWRDTGDGFEVRAPHSGAVLAEVCRADEALNAEAIAAAEGALAGMARLARFQIAKGLRKIAEGIEARRKELTETIALEASKPVSLCRAEVERAVATFNCAAGEAERFVGEIVPVDTQAAGRGKFAHTRRVPKGVVYGITPFNYPLNLAAHKVAPALASGNSIIIKPSPRTPLAAIILGEIFLESGLPRNALQIVPTDVGNIDAVLADDRVAMVSFTGSAEVGWSIKARAPRKTVALELGGSAPVIVDETADLGRALEKTLTGAFVYSGQVCISVQRIYVHESRFDEFAEGFAGGARRLVIGDPLDEKTQIAHMIDVPAAERAHGWVREALDNGATALCGNQRDGGILHPTVLTGTSPEMRVVSSEIFAPVCVVERYTEFEEAVDAANATKYGLQAGVFTGSLARASYASEHLRFGGVIINDVPTFRVDNMPYGGVKDSGYGREGVRYAMEEMTDVRIVVTNA